MQMGVINRYISIGIFIGFCFIFFIVVSSPIGDADFFWHIATGRWIFEHKTIPYEDFLSTTTPPDAYKSLTRTNFILQQFWLAQLIIYSVYSFGGYVGVVIFVSLVFSFILLLLFLWLRAEGLRILSTLVFLLLPAYLLGEFVGARPNQMTFLMVLISFYFIEQVRKQSKKGFLLPLIMLLWSNLHGGFIIGDVIILIYAFTETARKVYFARRGETYKGYHTGILVYGVSLAFSFINPQGFNAFIITAEMETSLLYKAISENQSPWVIMSATGTGRYFYICIIYLVFSIVHITLTIKERRFDLAHMLLLLFLILISFKAIRFIPIMGILSAPILIKSLSEYVEKGVSRVERLLVPQFLFLALILMIFSMEYKNTVFNRSAISEYFPAGAVNFIKEKGLTGNIFGILDWGGYLEWELYPQKRTFIDGRDLVLSVFNLHAKIIDGADGWDKVLDRYEVKNIILPPVTKVGGPIGLINQLYKDDRWKFVYRDGSTFVFSKNEGVMEIPKFWVVTDVIAAANRMATGDNPLPYISVARLLEEIGRKYDAIAYLEEAVRKRPYLKRTETGAELSRLKGQYE